MEKFDVLAYVKDESEFTNVKKSMYKVLNDPSTLEKMNLKTWVKNTDDIIFVGAEARYDEGKQESFMKLTLINRKNESKKRCFVVSGDEIKALGEKDYDKVDKRCIPQTCSIDYSLEYLIKGVVNKKIEGISKGTNTRIPQGVKPKPQPLKKGMMTNNVPVVSYISMYHKEENESALILDSVNRLLSEKAVFNGPNVKEDGIVVNRIGGIANIKKVEATYDKEKDRCIIKVVDPGGLGAKSPKREVSYIVDGKNIVPLKQGEYEEALKGVDSKKLKHVNYVTKHKMNLSNGKLELEEVRDKDKNVKVEKQDGQLNNSEGKSQFAVIKGKYTVKSNTSRETKLRSLCNSIQKLAVKSLHYKVYKVLSRFMFEKVLKGLNDVGKDFLSKKSYSEKERRKGIKKTVLEKGNKKANLEM